jgi:hypothetical protein
MERARLGYLVALLMTAGHPSRAIADTNASTGCDEGKWTYADDSHKQATARGKLKKVDLASDGDAHLNITPTEDSKALLKDKNNTVDQRDYLTTEVHLIANQGGDVSKFAGLVNSKFKVGMNAIADGDWVVDEHDYNIFRNVFAGDRDTRWTELHPLRTMRASNEPDPTATSNFVYLSTRNSKWA